MIGGDIKKISLSYAKCPAGDLHTGEILSLVCVDTKCQKRGLICPICKMMNHEEHQVLPLKIFIDQVKKSFLQSQDSFSLNNLSDYLRSIDQSKTKLLNALRQTAQSIAKQLKKVQQKIQQNYLSIRKNILAQSTMSTKLPIFIENLVKKQQNDPYKIQEEFQRYSQLIKFNNSIIQISDKAKKIVEDYSQLANQISNTLKDQVQNIKTGFKDLIQQKTTKVSKKSQTYTFSTQHKQVQLKISEDKKQVYSPQVIQQYGVAYVNEVNTNPIRKINFRIEVVNSGNVIIGMGLPKKDKELAYIYSSPIQNQHFCINSDGYFQNYDDQESSNSDIIAPSFFFNQVGTQVSISLQSQKNQITFAKVGTQQKKVLLISKLSEENKKELQFFVSLGQNDRIRIVDN